MSRSGHFANPSHLRPDRSPFGGAGQVSFYEFYILDDHTRLHPCRDSLLKA